MDRDELAAWLRLTLSPGVGNSAARRLLARLGLPQAVFAQTESALQQIVSAAQARALRSTPPNWQALLDTTWRWLHDADTPAQARAIVSLGDGRYPQSLLDTPDPPLLLYLTGPERLLVQPRFAAGRCLAIVGSRSPSAQGVENARLFARALRGAGLCIVSGLALGIDAAAHQGALELDDTAADGAATLAVVGTGLDQVYPRQNRALAQRIAARGLIVSEFPLGTPPLATNFPKRNRIIAGLSQGTLVVEAATASGSLITARLAVEQGREVFAIPGSIHAPQSRGCHALIRQGAKLVESAQDVLEELPGFDGAAAKASTPEAAMAGAAAGDCDDPLLQALGHDPQGVDALLARTGMDTAALQAALLDLELAGLIARLPGGLFQRLGRG